MTAKSRGPAPTLQVGDEVAGFRIERVQPVAELQATAYLARHGATGAEVLHLHGEDRENLFTVTLRTPPPDSRGVAHILEHSVLAGSAHYPVKDAFKELQRGSLNTFINAFTGPDFTCYPVCSQVPADFYNLATVYLDLVLRPLITRATFMREAHHLEFDDQGRLTISGIVYNEMKGAYSTAERISQSLTLQSLFPDTPYGVESGGRPDAIPELTYEEFRDFHRRYYSPSNARFFLYGNLATRRHLEFLGAQLAGFERIAVDSAVPDQPRWDAPRRVAAAFPIGSSDPHARRTTVNVAWLTTPAVEVEERLVLEVLQEALVGNAAAPLRRALIDSGLGEDLSPLTGLLTWFRELPFVVGLRGTEETQAEAIETLTLETLRALVRDGIPSALLEAAFHQVEFRGLEITRDPLPFPLTLLFRSLNTWLHERDPLLPLTFPTLMGRLRERWQSEPNLFAQALERWLLTNPHRLRAVIHPSRTLAAEQDEALRARLDTQLAALGESEREAIRTQVAQLNAEQQAPDAPEELAKLPRLEVSDIPREVETVPTAERRAGGVVTLEHELFANGIAYLDVAFDVRDVPDELQPYLPLFGAATTGMGAAGEDYAAFAQRQALATGGVSADLEASDRVDGGGTVEQIVFSSRALARNVPAMVAVVRDMLASGDLTDTARLKDILSAQRNQLRAAVAPQGHRFGWRAAAAGLSRSAWRDEQWHGATQVRFLRDRLAAFEQDPAAVVAALTRLREQLLRRGRMVVNLTGEAELLGALRAPVAELIAALPEGGEAGEQAPLPVRATRTGIALPGEVCYVARVLPVAHHNDAPAPLLHLLANHLGSGWLYKKIRIEGGAYGGFAVYAPLAGQFAMLSYRDPNLEATLAVYDRAVETFLQEDLGEDELRTMVIGALGKLDRPMDPPTRGRAALQRWRTGLRDEDRQRFRDGVLGVKREALRACAREVLQPALARAAEAVIGPRERIEQANQVLPTPFAIEGLD